LQAVRRNGGARNSKANGNAAQRTKGLDATLKANRPDLTLEAIILRDQFRSLFTADELRVAEAAWESTGARLLGIVEGARKQIRVNAYERDRRARRDCLKHYGLGCAVCGLVFEQIYGELGKGFIHVHHLRPLALCDSAYTLSAVEDLRPVCPNCHAMLHHSGKVLSIEELNARMSNHG
jgi:5-methylcytosine-specific restriction protein A